MAFGLLMWLVLLGAASLMAWMVVRSRSRYRQARAQEDEMSDFFETRTAGRVDEVENRLEAALKERKFGTLHVHDVTGTLNSKGVPFDTPMRIMDICHPHHARKALDATGNRIAPLLPCSVALWQEGDEVVVRFLRPTALARFFPGAAELAGLAKEVNVAVEAAVEQATGDTQK